MSYDKLLPEIKKLDRDNLLRLSGFIEALLFEKKNPEKPLEEILEQPTITIVYATQSGNAKALGEEFNNRIQQQGFFNSKLLNIADLSLKKLTKHKYLLFIVSTYGEGEPPDSALEFYQQFNKNASLNLKQLNYGIISLGDSSYDKYCEFGIWLDLKMQQVGANSLLARLDCDVEYDEEVAKWAGNFFTIINKNNNQQQIALKQNDNSSKTQPISAKNPLEVEVLRNINLCTEKADKKVFHLELDAPNLPYQAGDALGIIVANSQKMVVKILNIISLPEQTQVNFANKTISLQECLQNHAELFRITGKQINKLLDIAENSKLASLTNTKEKLSIFALKNNWLNLLQFYTKKKPFDSIQKLIDLFNPKINRLYSICSSPSTHQDEIHICVRLLQFSQNNIGLASGFIANLSTENKVKVFIKPNANFNLPENQDVPLIMIGAGTGIAPFRSFLFERKEKKMTSPSWLFFGEQKFRESFLYQNEWLQMLENGALSKLTTAFSRDNKKNKKIYVQNRLLENAQELYQWIQQGAYIYICGDAKFMAPSVHAALLEILATQIGELAAKEKLQKMLLNKKYQRDIY